MPARSCNIFAITNETESQAPRCFHNLPEQASTANMTISTSQPPAAEQTPPAQTKQSKAVRCMHMHGRPHQTHHSTRSSATLARAPPHKTKLRKHDTATLITATLKQQCHYSRRGSESFFPELQLYFLRQAQAAVLYLLLCFIEPLMQIVGHTY